MVEWLRLHGICHIAVPNAGKRSFRAASRLKAEGLAPGFPDLLIFDRPPLVKEAIGVALEMKRNSKTARLDPLQKWWSGLLTDRGWVSAVAYGATEAIKLLKDCGYGRRAA